MERKYYEFVGEISDDNIIETTLTQEVELKGFFKKVKISFFKNLILMFLNLVALSIIELIFQTLGMKILYGGTITMLNLAGLPSAYALIFIGAVLINLKPIKENSLFKDLILLLQILSPFIALTYISQLGVALTGIGSVTFFTTFLLVRWTIIQKFLVNNKN